jgi:molybdopterin synthase sulfur carrier subunit
VNRNTFPAFFVPTVFIPAQMRDMTRGVAQLVVAGDTVSAVVDELEAQFPGIRQRLCRGDSLAPGLQVSVDSTVTLRGLRSRLQPGSELHFLPAFGGG